MNLNKLFQAQKVLDAHIEKEKGLQGVDLLDKKILALLVELGELANELPEIFKFWSDKKNNYEKALEEYVDCLHFTLSIGLEDSCSCIYVKDYQPMKVNSFEVTEQFISLNESIADFWYEKATLEPVIMLLFGLGEMIGFTKGKIEQAYFDKNKVNHTRQENGY